MNGAVQRYLDAASGLTSLTKSKAEAIVRQLVKQGEAASDQVGELVDELLERQRSNREAVSQLVRAETQRVIRAMGLATQAEVERLQAQVTTLEKALAEAGSGSGTATTPRKKAAKKAAKKATKKATGKRAAKKTAAKKAGAKKTAAKKSAAKKTAAKKSGKRTSGGGR